MRVFEELNVMVRRLVLFSITMVVLAPCPAWAQGEVDGLDVRIETDEAEAVLHILEQRSRGQEVSEAGLASLRSTQGYARLKERQESFGQTDFDARFERFLLSDEVLSERAALRRALEGWSMLDATGPAARAHAYLPLGTQIRATIYPVIKERTNSFVFDLGGDPAIFMFMDPDIAVAELDNTLSHELHHVGSTTCSDPVVEGLSEDAQTVVSWLSAFGEGMAVLAAAGGPDIHPHASSSTERWAVWERDVANFNSDLPRIQHFFERILDGKLEDATERRTALFEFISSDEVPQGAFYTVGWKMAALVERSLGRETVVRGVCDPRILLEAYNRAASRHGRSDEGSLALWSEEFLARLRPGDGVMR